MNTEPISPSTIATAAKAKSTPTKSKFWRSATIVTLFSLVNMVLSFLTQTVLAAQFGTSMEMDAYWAALSLPLLINTVLIGALNITLVPFFVEHHVLAEGNGQDIGLWQLASNFFNLLLVVLTIIALVVAVLAVPLISLLLPGFASNSTIFSLTVTLLRILMPGILFSGLAAFLSSIYYAQSRFLVPAILPALNAGCILLGAWFWSPYLGVKGVAWAYLLGGVAQFLLTAPILLRPQRYHFYLNLRHESTRQVLIVMLPWVFGALISKANPLVDRFLVSSLPVGSVSYLGYAYTLNQVIIVLVSKGISVVIFPILARQAAQRHWSGMYRDLVWAMEVIGLMVLPIMVLVLLFQIPLIQLFYERGSFTPLATVATGWAWVAYLGAFVGASLGSVVSYVFYALKKTYTMMKIGLVGFVLNVVLAVLLTNRLGYWGPAIAFSLVTLMNFFVTWWVLQKLLRDLGEVLPKGAGQLSRWFLIFLLLWLFGWAVREIFMWWWVPVGFMGQVLWLTAAFLLIGLGYLLSLWALPLRPVVPLKQKIIEVWGL